jgi:hypothetical protein
LDLKQKQANIEEAIASSNQAKVVLIFTIVTVIFVSWYLNMQAHFIPLTRLPSDATVVHGGLIRPAHLKRVPAKLCRE